MGIWEILQSGHINLTALCKGVHFERGLNENILLDNLQSSSSFDIKVVQPTYVYWTPITFLLQLLSTESYEQACRAPCFLAENDEML